ncbi:hypothetical protein [Desulfitobacterium chlororespirans]|uniref:DUF8042 domain-containing protein n=1 Tax=Desulfitobacterium chlororespirans DSM 11544 TaxID=1121395 RepID=A0A1M7UDB6_9FIRM|nr:hypothetical protein [Desulfitobacterium chlororespirans]SHN80948.1 hypothetical protein SAMN02745215_03494 [Desulfitobacterium chlororespirans DSM 11544]
MNQGTSQRAQIIHYSLELLPTIEEALLHMQKQLEELRLEESAVLLTDVSQAIGKIVHYSLPMLNESRDQFMMDAIIGLRESMELIADAYEDSNLAGIQDALRGRLIPAFVHWRYELLKSLGPAIAECCN